LALLFGAELAEQVVAAAVVVLDGDVEDGLQGIAQGGCPAGP